MTVDTRRAVILGTRGFAVELHALLTDQKITVLGFAGPPDPHMPDLPAPYLGDDSAIATIEPDAQLFVAVGEPAIRRRLFDRIARVGRTPGGFVHPAAYVAHSAVIGAGAIVYPNATVHGRVQLGTGVVVNSNASVGHECEIGAFSNLNPGVALGGRIRMAPGTYVGIGASLVEEISVCEGVVIGAGATVTDDIRRPGTYIGTPARLMAA
jgi:sugar O-acyltransferase (sialic acid O-acetyltransferase NeuD family)